MKIPLIGIEVSRIELTSDDGLRKILFYQNAAGSITSIKYKINSRGDNIIINESSDPEYGFIDTHKSLKESFLYHKGWLCKG